MADAQKKRKNLGGMIGMTVAILVGACVGFFGAQVIDSMSGGNDGLFCLYLGGMLLGLYLAFLVQIIVHEGGHLVCGLISGYRFVSFNVLGLIWQKDAAGNLRVGRMQLASGAGGQCLMAPPDYNGGDYPFTLYNLGGVLANLLFSGLCGILALLIPNALVRILFLTQALVGIALALVNGLPLPIATLQNDGKNLLCIRKDEAARRAFWLQMSIAAEIARGVRLKSMPEEWFAPQPEEAMDNPIVSAIAVLNTSRLMDALDFAAAEREIRTLLARKKGILGLYRMTMSCDGAVCELLAGRPGQLCEALSAKENQQMMKAMKNYPSILRTQYALALLQEQDADKAGKLLSSFDAAAKKYPNPQEIDGEREIIFAIQTTALKGGCR